MVATSPVNDSTVEQIGHALEQANTLLESVEALQKPLANAKRRLDAGQEVEHEKILNAAHKKVPQIVEELKHFSAEQEPEEVNTVIQSGAIDYWSHVGSLRAGIPSGLGKLNDMLNGGLSMQKLMILLGAPGGGKTTLANQIAERFASGDGAGTGNPVLYVTSEDIPFNLLSKTLARKGKINYSDVLRGRDTVKPQINEAYKEYQTSVAGQFLHYYDATLGCDLDSIRSSAEALFNRYPSSNGRLLVIDYLQRIARAHPLYRDGNFDLRKAVTLLTEDLRQVAVSLDCCVLVLASQNRASGYGAGNSSLSSGKESGDIEYTADVLMALGDDDRTPTMPSCESRVLRLDKNRLGPCGSIALDWYGARQQFTCADVEASESSNGRRKGR